VRSRALTRRVLTRITSSRVRHTRLEQGTVASSYVGATRDANVATGRDCADRSSRPGRGRR
jgi:hypothetical protein